MGLDMYLRAERYLWWNEDELQAAVGENFPELPEGATIKQVEAEVGYWRKANAVHRWFVNNIQDGVDECQKSPVDRDDLKRLRDQCQQVLDNPDVAAGVLPTQEGFFFGSTTYDESYLSDLRDTVAICDRAIALADKWDLYYQSSW